MCDKYPLARKALIPVLVAGLLCMQHGNFASAYDATIGAASPSPSRGRMSDRSGRVKESGLASLEERRMELVKRFIARAIDDLNDSLAMADDEGGEIEKDIDAITLLESQQREKDFRSLLDWYLEYGDWLKEMIAEYEDDLQSFSSGAFTANEQWRKRCDVIARKFEELARQIGKKAEQYLAEEKRLAGVLDRRQQLRGRFDDLEARLARIEDQLRDLQSSVSEKRESERKAKKIRTEIRTVQDQLLALPQVDEDLLKHYLVLSERGDGERAWLGLKSDEYEALLELARVIDLDPRRDAAVIETSYRRMTRVLEGEINKLKRRGDELYRKRSRIVSAGTLREVDRSQELADYYERLRGRYEARIDRLRSLIGVYDADLAEIVADKGR